MTKIVNRVKPLHAARSGQLPDLGSRLPSKAYYRRLRTSSSGALAKTAAVRPRLVGHLAAVAAISDNAFSMFSKTGTQSESPCLASSHSGAL
jgi:hypothetical protein